MSSRCIWSFPLQTAVAECWQDKKSMLWMQVVELYKEITAAFEDLGKEVTAVDGRPQQGAA